MFGQKISKSGTSCDHYLEALIITRSERVALMMNFPTSPYHLEGLAEEPCWSLFMQLEGREHDKHRNLLPIGQKIVKKSEGVALATKTLESLMCLSREQKGVAGCAK